MSARHRLRHDLVYYPFRALLAIGGHLGLQLLRPLGAAAGRLALTLAATDGARARAHLAIAFPGLDEPARERLLRASARHLGLNLAEVIWLWRASAARVAELATLSGDRHLADARSAGRGAVLVTGHCGNWELLNARLGVGGIPMSIAVREVYDPRLHDLATALRARFGAEVVVRGPAAGRALARALLANRVTGLLIDQDIRDVPATFVSFFGRPAWTPTGAATLAVRLGVPVVPAFIHRLPDGRHHAEVHPPLPDPGGSSEDRVAALTTAATAAIEAQVRSHPEQWVWMHRRWRTEPAPPT